MRLEIREGVGRSQIRAHGTDRGPSRHGDKATAATSPREEFN